MSRTKLVLGIGAAAVVMLTSTILGTSSANADSAVINGWASHRCPGIDVFCLYYSQNAKGAMDGRAVDASNGRGNAVPLITGTFSGGGAGSGDLARNNAASVENNVHCHVGIWVSPNYQGDSDWLTTVDGGNLGPALHNNEASIAVDDTTSCPGWGIG